MYGCVVNTVVVIKFSASTKCVFMMIVDKDVLLVLPFMRADLAHVLF